ncbi:Pirin-like protein [Chitinispirillum alkaliphilum]|nr:Pirin-like protein [Chitinispirillum alkaliphilum]
MGCERVYSAREIAEGEGARVKRLFPGKEIRDFDPFVLLDEFFVDAGTGFPDHPHRGFEALTYMLEGSFRHKDNMGNDTEVATGGVQKFSAGRGLVHSEMPGEKASVAHGIQLWVNLPRRLKNSAPSYMQVQSERLQVREIDGGYERVIAGDGSEVRFNTEIKYFDVKLKASSEYRSPSVSALNGIIYVYEGSVMIGSRECVRGEGFLFDQVSHVTLRSLSDTKFILVAGMPHGEPIIHKGSYVD